MAVSLSPDDLVFFAPFVSSVRRCENADTIDQVEIREDLFQAAADEAFSLCGLTFVGDGQTSTHLVITEQRCLAIKQVRPGQGVRATVQLTGYDADTLRFALALHDAQSGEIVALSFKTAVHRCSRTHGHRPFGDATTMALANMMAAHARLPVPEPLMGRPN
jgi:acyl-CoA thioesterase FadM